ncbi:hypothetical protein DFH94DRAFT_358806 [Russula ochroleuca]|uniref:Uncharacterized protein n=1 Tax=Russula ochroleuca TaxID=152965 RepID=A0A9P5JUJ8_9AGAM|nr:hypothetical protein DFH94DRAFT_358806 [Russula ochroleuca]
MVFSPLALRHCHPYLLPSRATRAKKQRARDRQSLVTSQRWSAFHATARPGRLGVEYYTVTIDATFHLFSVVPFKFYHWLLRTCLTHTSRGGVKRCQSCCVVCLPCTRPQSPASSHLKPDGPTINQQLSGSKVQIGGLKYLHFMGHLAPSSLLVLIPPSTLSVPATRKIYNASLQAERYPQATPQFPRLSTRTSIGFPGLTDPIQAEACSRGRQQADFRTQGWGLCQRLSSQGWIRLAWGQ